LNAAGVKSDAPHIVGQGGHEPVGHFGEFEHQSASAAQARNEPGSASGASVTNSPSAAPAETGEAPSPDPASPVTPITAKPAHGPCERIAREKPTNEPALVAPAGALGLTNQHGYEAPTPPAINPNCAHPDTCKWARSMASCSACANAVAKARAA
jgi:hypothetical protein